MCSVAPTLATANPASICPGTGTELCVEDGVLGPDSSWVWYSDTCGGTYVDTGECIGVSPPTTTTYYVRAEGGCGPTSCAQVEVTVRTESTAPVSAVANPSTPVCPNTPVALSVNGGSLGTGASWRWYNGSCGGTLMGTGSSIAVAPTSTTTYYVRAEGSCNTTTCTGRTISLTRFTLNVSTNGTTPPSGYTYLSGGTVTPGGNIAVQCGVPVTVNAEPFVIYQSGIIPIPLPFRRWEVVSGSGVTIADPASPVTPIILRNGNAGVRAIYWE
jgi:hypothetical protein